MQEFISEYITSLTSRQRESIHDILSAAQVGKQDLDSIVTRLSDIRKNAPIVIQQESFNSQIKAGKFDGTYRDAYRRISELFDASNLISLVLDSYNTILTSEARALEDELTSIEKAISNYAFTLSDNGFYDYAFTETFNDETMRETDENIVQSDRSGTAFAPDERALINTSSGTLTLNPALVHKFSMTGSIVDSNCGSLVTSDTGIENALSASAFQGWRRAISSPKPFSTSILGQTKKGAQVKIELILQGAAPCDTIVFVPFSDIPTEILSINIFDSASAQESSGTSIITDPVMVDKPINVSFPLQTVAKIIMVLNQSIFTRAETPSNKYEETYRAFYETVKDQKQKIEEVTFKSYNKNKKALHRVFLHTQATTDRDFKYFQSYLPQIDFDEKYGPMTIDRIINGPATYGKRADMWEYQSKINNYFRNMIHESLFNSNPQLLNDNQVFNATSVFNKFNSYLTQMYTAGVSQEFPRVMTAEPSLNANAISATTLNEATYLDYNYNLGMRDIQVGVGERIFRGIFISKPIPADTDSGEVKLKTDDINYEVIDSPVDTGVLTSIEYSVSNKSNPKDEQDWLPILPIDDELVIGERLFLNDAGSGYFRFPVSLADVLTIYKNGHRVDPSVYVLVYAPDQSSIVGVKIPINTFLNTDIFTVDYQPVGSQQVVNFIQRGLGQSLLASAYDDKGAGETFSGTFDNQTVGLKFNPYIDYDAVKNYGSYSPTLGFTGGYAPITVIMADGTVAVNLTNYKGTIQTSLADFDPSKIAYIQSGPNVTFNQAITTAFTVYYQYIPSNLRVRIILRVNSTTYVSPIVNSIQVKTKTYKPDPKRAF